MSISSWNAGIIRPVAVAPTGPFQDGAAPGVWTLDQATFWIKQGLWPTAGNASPIALFAGGYSGDSVNIIDRLSLTTQGNATDFGDLTQPTFQLSCGGGASRTRGVWGGGSITGGNRTNVIQYVTIATTGNALDFGDLIEPNYQFAGTSNVHGGL